jgi:hypothetical protein
MIVPWRCSKSSDDLSRLFFKAKMIMAGFEFMFASLAEEEIGF